MTCRFILGRAGEGKSRFCLEQIAQRLQNGEKKLYLLVPDQSSFINEKLLAELTGGFADAQVTGFGRLSYEAADFLNKANLPQLNEVGRTMLTARLLLEHKDELQSFARMGSALGFAEALQKLFEEFRTCRLEASAAAAACADMHGNFADKIHDITLLYELYQQETEACYNDSAACLDLLAEAIDAGFMDDAVIYLDGFASFDPTQLGILAALFRRNTQVFITLPLAADDVRKRLPEEHFLFKQWELYHKLRALAEENGAELLPDIVLQTGKGRFAEAPELQFLAEHLLPLNKKAVWQDKPQQIHINVAADRRQELSGIGRTILHLVRDGGLRFNEISICARQIDDYKHDMEQIFTELGIPYFSDGKKELIDHPLIELIRAALDIAAAKPEHRRMFRYLKNPLSPLSLAEVCVLENYCLAQGVKFYHWQMPKAWDYFARSLGGRREEVDEKLVLQEVNAARFKGTAELWRFCDALKKSDDVAGQMQAIRAFLSDLQVERRLEQMHNIALAEGRAEEAEMHRQAAKDVYMLLEQAEQLLGQTQMDIAMLAAMLDSGFASLRTSMIPPSADQVFVASVDRSRTPNVKVNFVLGLNEGVFPAKISSGGILNGRDRELLEQKGFELAPSAAKRQLAEYYLLYIALTRSSQQLYLSYVLTDGEDRALLPSMAIRRIKQLFPALEEGNYQYLPLELEVGGNDTLARMAIELRRRASGLPTPGYWDAFRAAYAELDEYKNNLLRVTEGLYFRPGPADLQAASAGRLFGSRLYSSVSRLESFAKCPLAYFANYSLHLQKRQEYKLASPDLGSFFHAVMEKICREISEKNISWQDIDEKTAEALVRKYTEEISPQLLGNILGSAARLRYLQERFIMTLTNALLVLAGQMQKGEFRQLGWELTFGPHGVLPSFDIALADGRVLKLSGCIDRLDAAVDGDKVWLRVVDYKSGEKDLKIKDVFEGLSLQLLIYLQVAMLNAHKLGLEGEPHAAGGFYFTFRENFTTLDKNDADFDSNSVRMSGLAVQDMAAVKLADRNVAEGSTVIPVRVRRDGSFAANSGGVSEEELELLQKHLLHILEESAAKLYRGTICAIPSRGEGSYCNYCDYRSFCAFDFDLASPKEKAPSLDRQAIFDKIREELANDDD